MNIKEKLKLLAEYEELIKKEAELKAKMLPLKAKENYAAYVEYTHRYDRKFKIARFQKYICDCIDKLISDELLNDKGEPYTGICLSQPPQTGKSRCVTETVGSYYLGRFPLDHVIEIAYGEDLAVKFGRRNKQKVNEFGKELFDIQLSSVSSSALEFEIEGTNGGMISRGIGGAITGNPADLIVLDDPYKNRQEADSPIYQKFVIDEWLNTIQTRASAKCKYLVVHTRWNEDDLIGYLLQTEPDKWFEIKFPAIAEHDEPEIGRKAGEALLPEAGKDLAWLLNKKKSYENDPMEGGLRAWEALYQQNPTSKDGNMVKREWWKRYILKKDMYFPVMVQSWDCTFKDTDGTDHVAGHVWGKIGANYYLIDRFYERADVVATIKAITNMSAKHPRCIAKLIEDKANGPAVIRLLRDKISGIIAQKAIKSKAERLNAVLPLWEAGNIYIPEKIEVDTGVYQTCTWANEVIEQFAAFRPEKKVQKDDHVDAGSYALNWLYFQTADMPGLEQHYNFDFERPRDDSGYFGTVTSDYLNYGG